MATNKKKVPKEADDQQLSIGVVFHLEETAFHKRRIMYDALSHVLDGKGIQMTPQLYSRYCLTRSVDRGIAALLDALGKKKISAEKLATEVNNRVDRFLKKNSFSLDSFLSAILAEAQEQNVIVGALSALPAESASSIVSRFKLDDFVKLQVIEDPSQDFPTPDCWLQLAKILELHSSRCLALATCATSCHSALSAGMRCVVIPDEFTFYQDFGGADMIVEDHKKLSLNELLPLMHICSFR